MLTSGPDLLELSIAIFPAFEVLLHVAVKVFPATLDELVVAYVTKPRIFDMPESFSRATDDDTAIRARNQIVVLLAIETKTIRIW